MHIKCLNFRVAKDFTQVLLGVTEHRERCGCTSLVPCAIGCYTKVEDRCCMKGEQGTIQCVSTEDITDAR